MADDIRLQITGDVKKAEKLVSRFEKLTKRWEKTNKAATKRRVSTDNKANRAIESSRQRNIQRLMRLEAKQTRMQQREAEKRIREAARQAKREVRERERILRRHARNRQRILRGVGRGVGGALGLLGVGGVAGAIFKGREILRFDEQLARVSGQAKITTKRQFEIRDAINKTSLATGTQRDVILRAVDQIVDKSGNIDLATENIEGLAIAMRGTGAEAEDMGRLIASVYNSAKNTGFDITPKEAFNRAQILAAQGDVGQVTIQNLASEGEKLFGALKGSGLADRKNFISFGALIQAAGETGDAAEAATSAVRVLSSFRKKQGAFGKAGIQVFKPGSKEELKDIDVLLKEIFTKTGGMGLERFFEERAIKPMNVLAAEFKKTGDIKSFIDSINIGRNAAENLRAKFDRVAATSSQGFERMAAGITLFADTALVGVMNDMANAMQKFIDDPEAMERFIETAKGLGDVLSLIAKVGGGAARVISRVVGSVAGIGEDFKNGRFFSASTEKEKERMYPHIKRLRENVEATENETGRLRAEALALYVKTDIKTDAAGKIKSTETTAELNNPDRGEKQTVQVGELQYAQ